MKWVKILKVIVRVLRAIVNVFGGKNADSKQSNQ